MKSFGLMFLFIAIIFDEITTIVGQCLGFGEFFLGSFIGAYLVNFILLICLIYLMKSNKIKINQIFWMQVVIFIVGLFRMGIGIKNIILIMGV